MNFINGFLVVALLAYCYKYPRRGIVICFLLLLCLPLVFLFFGFSFGDGEKYLPNIFIIGLFYTVFYFLRSEKSGSIDKLDIAIVFYLLLATAVTMMLTGVSFNPGVWVKQFGITPLFYFMGKVYLDKPGLPEQHYLRFRNLLLALGPYFVVSILIEYFARINLQAVVQSFFIDLVGARVFSDPLQLFASHNRAEFFRVLGPLSESSESQLVVLMIFVIYLAWTGTNSTRKAAIRYFMLLSLVGMMLLGGTRSIMISLPPVLIAKEALNPARRRWVLSSYILLGIFIVFVAVTDFGGLTSTLQHDFSETAYYSQRLMNRDTFVARFSVWSDALALISQNVLFGVGIGTAVHLLGPESSIYTSHNFYLDVLLFQGIFVGGMGIALFVVLIGRGVRTVRQYGDSTIGRLALTQILLAVAIFWFYLSSPEKVQSSALFWFYGGLLAAATTRKGATVA